MEWYGGDAAVEDSSQLLLVNEMTVLVGALEPLDLGLGLSMASRMSLMDKLLSSSGDDRLTFLPRLMD